MSDRHPLWDAIHVLTESAVEYQSIDGPIPPHVAMENRERSRAAIATIDAHLAKFERTEKALAATRRALAINADNIRDVQFHVSYAFAEEPESLSCIGCGAISEEKLSYGGFTYPTCKEGCSWTALVAAAHKCE